MLTDIIKATFNKLNKDGVPATPDMYRKYFCQESKKLGIYSAECNSINSLKDSLSYKNRSMLKKLNIESMDDLLGFLTSQLENMEKIPQQNHKEEKSENNLIDSKNNLKELIGVVDIIKDALKPSVGNLYSEEIDDINKLITENPQLLTKEETQEKIKKLVKGRASFDRRSIINKTTQLSNITDTISTSLNKSIHLNESGSNKLLNIKAKLNDIENVDLSNKKNTQKLKNHFISIAGAIELEATKLSTNLKKEHTKVNSITKDINFLKTHLKKAENKNDEDFLTQTYTKESFDEILSDYDFEYEKNNVDYAGILFDFDWFTKVNKIYSYDAGDKVISTFAKLLLKEFDNLGKICRHGGDRFLIIIPDININDASSVAIKILNILRKSMFNYKEEKIKVTLSGSVCLRSNNNSNFQFIDNLYKVLKKAKANGKNRVEICNLKSNQSL